MKTMMKSIVLKTLTGVTATVLTVAGIAVPAAISSKQNTDDIFAVAEEDTRAVEMSDAEIAGDVTVDYDWMDAAGKEQVVTESEQIAGKAQVFAESEQTAGKEQVVATSAQIAGDKGQGANSKKKDAVTGNTVNTGNSGSAGKSASEQPSEQSNNKQKIDNAAEKTATEKAVAAEKAAVEKAEAEQKAAAEKAEAEQKVATEKAVAERAAAGATVQAQNIVHTPVTLPANNNVVTGYAECHITIPIGNDPEPAQNTEEEQTRTDYGCGYCGYYAPDMDSLYKHFDDAHPQEVQAGEREKCDAVYTCTCGQHKQIFGCSCGHHDSNRDAFMAHMAQHAINGEVHNYNWWYE